MRKYEIMYILKPELDQNGIKAANEKLAKILTDNGGKVTKTDEWGLKDLAYEINKAKKGYYVVLEIEAENKALDEFKRVCSLDADVLRFLITKAHESAPVAAVAAASEKTPA